MDQTTLLAVSEVSDILVVMARGLVSGAERNERLLRLLHATHRLLQAEHT